VDTESLRRAAQSLPGFSRAQRTEIYRRVRLRSLRGPELRFTPPRPDCPHPEWWTSTDSDSAELEVTELVVALVRALQPDFVIETGTALGQTAELLGRALRRNGHGRLVSLEIDHGRVVRARERVARLPVEVIEQSSVEYRPTEPIDFAWLDSLPELRVQEFRNLLPYTHATTVVGFHDTGPTHDLGPQVDALQAEGLLLPLYLPTPRGVTFAQVPGRPAKYEL
jgi:hypothetical protein